jgi:hypothetical protein
MQHTAHFYEYGLEKFRIAIQINQSHSRTSRKTYDAAQRHGLVGLPPQSDYSRNSRTSTSSTRYEGNKSRIKTLCWFTEQRRTWWIPNAKSTTSATTRQLRNTRWQDQGRRPRIKELALQLRTRKWRIVTSRARYQRRGQYSYRFERENNVPRVHGNYIPLVLSVA